MKKIFVAGISTNVGKTVISAILTEYLQADYWKPIQTGSVEGRDLQTVKNLVSNGKSQFFEENYLFSQPYSPHYAAILDNQSVDIQTIIPPKTDNNLIIEGAGGLFVPLNGKELLIDLIPKIADEVILVCSEYLGSINHTLLSIEALQSRKIPIKGLIFNGDFFADNQLFILNYSQVFNLGHIPKLENISKENINKMGKYLHF